MNLTPREKDKMFIALAAMGEAMAEGSFIDRWRVRRDGALVYADTAKLDSAKLDGAIADQLGRRAVADGAIALATVLVAPGGADTLERVRALGDTFSGEVGISSWNGLAVARLIAKDGASLRHDIIALLAALGTSVPRLWLQ